MAVEKRDLLIHYDEDAKKLIFYTVPTTSTMAMRQSAFDGICPDIEYFKTLPVAEAEAKLGGLAFSIIDLYSINKIRIRDYEVEADAAIQFKIIELEAQAKMNDADAQYQLSHYLQRSAMKNRSMPDLERAEAMLMAAVEQGHAEASANLEIWPTIRGVTQRAINGKK